MDISKGNFGAACSDICSLIERSSFAAIDLEMTGISSATYQETPLDTPEKSYLAKRDAAKRYSIIQVGLCLFEEQEDAVENINNNNGKNNNLDHLQSQQQQQYHPSFLKSGSRNSSDQKQQNHQSGANNSNSNTLRLIARPFNFFVFPSGAPGGSNDPSAVFVPRDVVISPDAASFLRNHNMDWSRWIDHGVSYCNRIEMINARDKVWRRREEEKAAAPKIARETRALLSDEQKTWLDSCLVTASTFAASENRGGAECILPPIRNSSACVALRAAINNDSSLVGKISVSFRGKRGYQDCLLVRRLLTPEEETQRNLIDSVGFTNIFHTLLNQRKPIIGHNCMADWCFMMESFYEPLPPTLADFKEQMRVAAPAIYDTKIMSSGGCFSGPDEVPLVNPGTFESTHLGGLFKAFGGLGGCEVVGSSSASSSSGNNNNNSYQNSSSSTSGNTNNSSIESKEPPVVGNQSSLGKLEITLPLGFQNYSTMSSKGSSAHEAGFDALMTGAIFGHFLTKYHHTPLVDAAENKVALFRSMYALDLNNRSTSSNASAVSTSTPTSGFVKRGGKKGGFGSGGLIGGEDEVEGDNNTENRNHDANNQNTSSSSSNFSDVFLPGRHELLHIKHSLGSNVAPIENALRTCAETVSFFYGSITPGESGECLACIGRAGVNNNDPQNASAPQADAKKVENNNNNSGDVLHQRPKAVSISQLNERIEALVSATTKKAESKGTEKKKNISTGEEITDNKSETLVETQQQQQQQKKFTDEAALAVLRATTRTHILAPHMQFQALPPPSFGGSSNNKASSSSTTINRNYVPPPPKFKMDEFIRRDVKSLFRKVVKKR